MALEQIFSCPRTLARLQNGPLGELLEGFCQWLIHNGFSRWTIRTHLAHLSHLNTYLGPATAQVLTVVTAKDIEGFFRAYPLRRGNRGPLEQHLQRVRLPAREGGVRAVGLLAAVPTATGRLPDMDATGTARL